MIADRLQENNIIVNYQALPDDTTFLASSGIRTGVSEMTRYGMDEDDFGQLAELMARIILKNENVADEVADFRRKYTVMRYTLPLEKSIALAAGAMESAFPTGEYAKLFAENLRKL